MSDSIHVQRAGNVFRTELEALEHVAGLLDNAFHQTVESLVQTMDSRGKVVIIGIGKSGNIGRKIAATLTSTGTTSDPPPPPSTPARPGLGGPLDSTGDMAR